MTARSPNAFFLSAVLHGAVALLVLASLWLAQKSVREQPLIFETVRGEGDNFTATEAPALGTPSGLKLKLPRPVVPKPTVAPESAPDTPAPSSTKPSGKTVKSSTPTQSRTMTKAEFDKQNPGKAASSSKPAGPASTKIQQIDTKGILKGVAGGSTANTKGGAGGKAMTREESDALDAYYSMLVDRLRQAHQKPDGLSDLLQAQVEFHLNADGSITGAHIIVTSGNAAFDRSVLAAFRAMRALGPPPNGKADTLTITFKMSDDS
jgi:colicin import membrane protein